jgi:hypothetical protein
MFLKKSDLGYRPNREKQVAIWTNLKKTETWKPKKKNG